MNEQLPRIHSDPDVMRGMPVFVGSRLPVATLLACINGRDNWARLVESWPFLTPAHVEAALRYVSEPEKRQQP